MKKYWETGEKNDFGKECYRLHFSQFYEEDDENVLDNYLQPFDMVVNMYYPNNMKKEEFDKFLEETGYNKGE